MEVGFCAEWKRLLLVVHFLSSISTTAIVSTSIGINRMDLLALEDYTPFAPGRNIRYLGHMEMGLGTKWKRLLLVFHTIVSAASCPEARLNWMGIFTF